VGTVAQWVGVYNHADSHPTGLGPRLWRAVVGRPLAGLRARLLEAGRAEAFFEGKVAPEKDVMTHETADPLHIEWVYVVDAASSPRLHLLGHMEKGSGRDARWEHALVETFPLDGPEPDWAACEGAHTRRRAPALLATIRERFGEDAYLAARRQLLGEE
jgi:hypothetical protein